MIASSSKHSTAIEDQEDNYMWTRAELKQKAKMAFKRNYWKTVLISLLLALLVGAGAGSSSVSARGAAGSAGGAASYSSTDSTADTGEWLDEDDEPFFDPDMTGGEIAFAIVCIVIFVALFVAVILALAILFDALLINPAMVGTRRFFLLNLNSKAEVKEVGYGFDSNYKNIATVMFWRDLYIVLWSLLLIIPGIVKSYEYRMIAYLLAENPNMTKDEAFAISRQMMDGQKWKAFVLDLSFIGWKLLSVLTLGILSTFYVRPYKNMTDAALYEALKNNGAAAYIPQEE